MDPLLYVFLVTLFPIGELRMSIPLGLYLGAGWLDTIFVAVFANLLLGPAVFILLHKALVPVLKVSFMKQAYDFSVRRTRDRAKKYVDKWGLIGLILFIALPLPGSGSYTGALGGFLLGVRFKTFLLANTIGVLIAGGMVAAISLGVIG